MKTSFCSIAFRNQPDGIERIVSIVSKFGYRGVEIWGNHLPDISDPALDSVLEALQEHELSVPMISPYFDLTGSPERAAESVRSAIDYCRVCERLDARLLRVFTGVSGSADSTGDQYNQAIAALREMSAAAADHGVTLALETHPSTLVDSVPASLWLLQELGRDNVRLNLDIYHMWEVHGDPVEAFDSLRPFVAHIHAKNAKLGPVGPEHYPLLHDKQAAQNIDGVTYLEHGDMSYPTFLERLCSAGYAGYVSVEWFGPEPVAAAKHESAYLSKELAKVLG